MCFAGLEHIVLFLIVHSTSKLKYGKACSMHGNMIKTPQFTRSKVLLAVNMKILVFCIVASYVYSLVISLPDCIARRRVPEESNRHNWAFNYVLMAQ
jgi:hypothetical protein